MRKYLKSTTTGLVLLAAMAAAFGATPSVAQEGFPFGSELTLEAAPMRGSKRIPSMDIRPDGAVTIELPTRRVSVDGESVPLTRKEFDLLALLAQRPGDVFRREQIISEVWHTSREGTGRTLEVHVASLRSKLRMPALIETVRGVGYRLVAPAA